jgi:hypothetical protein
MAAPAEKTADATKDAGIDRKDESPYSPSSDSLAEAVGINEKALLRKLDYKLLPPLTLLYLLSYLDRSNGALPRFKIRKTNTD